MEEKLLAKIFSRKIKWDVSDSPDVVAHKVYIVQGTVAPTYTDLNVTVNMPATEVTVPDGFPGFPLHDGDYTVGIVAIDDWGNESDMEVATHPFDFIAPNAPTNIRVVA
jgi:hypothetical protein